MADPMNPELASLTLAAVDACRVLVFDRQGELGYVSRLDVPEYRVNSTGWPGTVESLYGSSKEGGPWDWGSLFGPSKDRFTKFDPTDVAELQDVINFVEANHDVAERISVFASAAHEVARRDQYLRADVIRWVMTLVQRAEALGTTSHDGLMSLYIELERGLLSQSVRGDLILPIALMNFELDTRLEVARGIAIEPIDEATHRARAPYLGGSGDVNPYLAAAATHAVVIEDQEFDNGRGPLVRGVLLATRPIDTVVAERVFQAIQIVSGMKVGYAQICLRPRGWASGWKHDLPPIERLQTVNRFPFELADGGWNKEQPTVPNSAMAKLPMAYAALSGTHNRAQLAARRLFQSSLRELDDDVVLDACIGIEALVGLEHAELSHRMGLRAAAALAPHGKSATRVYEMVKKVYDYRSKIVHGDDTAGLRIRLGAEAEDFDAGALAVLLLEHLLRAHVTSVPPWTAKALDQVVLDAIDAANVSDGPSRAAVAD